MDDRNLKKKDFEKLNVFILFDYGICNLFKFHCHFCKFPAH
jgi:hypothetical protein